MMVITKYEDYLLEQLLNESMMNEKINIDKIKDIVKKIGNKKETIKNLIKKFNQSNNFTTKKTIVTILVVLLVGNFALKNNKWSSSIEYNKNIEASVTSLINKAEQNGELTMNLFDVDGVSGADLMPPKEVLPIISMGTPGLIDDVNKVKPGRLDSTKIKYYDRYDKEILKALDELKAKGEIPDADLIKMIMVIETGMRPRKNSLGYEGFPQTKLSIINGWTDKDGKFHPGINQKHGTDFTMADMYKPGASAQFIYYYLKSVFMSDHVETIPDVLIAYNWGARNLGKYKSGVKDLPKQSADYVSMYNAMKPYTDNIERHPQS